MEDTHGQLAQQLQSGTRRLALALEAGVHERLIDYLLLLVQWNASYNLSGIRDPQRMVCLHLLDSLAVAPFVNGEVILDIGTGAGLPGIPLALCYPGKQFLLLDGNGKKTRFLVQAKARLGLDNVEIFQSRVQDFQCPRQIDIVVCRAFASLGDFVAGCRHLLATETRLLAMKGRYPEQEIADLPNDVKVTRSRSLTVPGVDGPRHLIELNVTRPE